MDEDRLVETVLGYMKNWLMVRCGEKEITVLPAAGRLMGYYPADFKGGNRD